MSISWRHNACGAAFVCLSTLVAADPVVLDTEQKALAALSAALFSSHEAPLASGNLSYSAEGYARHALSIIGSVTTSDFLRNTPAGVVTHCELGGTVKARIDVSSPTVLRLRWNGCVTNLYGIERTYDGPMSIGLVTESFQTNRISSVRLGNTNAEFVETYRRVTYDQIDNVVNSLRMKMQGDIALQPAYWYSFGSPVITAYALEGYSNNSVQQEFPDGRPDYFSIYRVSAQDVRVRNTTVVNSAADPRDIEDAQWLRGTVTVYQSNTGYGEATQTYTFDRFRVHSVIDYGAWIGETSVDGGIDIQWAPWWGTGCVSGAYTFNTRVPLTRELNTVAYTTGDLRANGTVVAKFFSSSNTPANLPAPVNGMLLNLRVRDAGVFNYDVSSTSEVLRPIGGCTG